MKNLLTFLTIVGFFITVCNPLLGETADTSDTGEIHIQNLSMSLSPDNPLFSEVLLSGEIHEVEVTHSIIVGPFCQKEGLSEAYDNIFLFLRGKGTIKAENEVFDIHSESIALPASYGSIEILVNESDTLHYLNIEKKRSQQDLEDIKAFPMGNRNRMYFTSFDECKAYTEKIKSANTVSRTVLPKAYVPRVAMGTVEARGPDQVGAHEHPMLDQLFLGLSGNNVTVHADDLSVQFPEYSMLHIPIGSSHGVRVKEGKDMYYMWMDFFLDKAGEAWLNTHKHEDE